MSRRRALALSLPLAAGIGLAQEFRATVVGKVTDPKQAAIAGASVDGTNTATGQVFRTVTNDEGNYITPFLNPGSVTAEQRRSPFPGAFHCAQVPRDVLMKRDHLFERRPVLAPQFFERSQARLDLFQPRRIGFQLP